MDNKPIEQMTEFELEEELRNLNFNMLGGNATLKDAKRIKKIENALKYIREVKEKNFTKEL